MLPEHPGAGETPEKVRPIGTARSSRKSKPKAESAAPQEGIPGMPAGEPAADPSKGDATAPQIVFAGVRVGTPRLEPKKIPGVPAKVDMIQVKIVIPGGLKNWQAVKALDGEVFEVRLVPLQVDIPGTGK